MSTILSQAINKNLNQSAYTYKVAWPENNESPKVDILCM